MVSGGRRSLFEYFVVKCYEDSIRRENLETNVTSLLKELKLYAKMGRRMPSIELLMVARKPKWATAPVGNLSGVVIPSAAHIPPRARWRESCKAPRMKNGGQTTKIDRRDPKMRLPAA